MSNKFTQRFLLSMLLSMLVALAYAQPTRTISGTVKDAQGEPVAFATYQIKGTNTGGATDAQGAFSVAVTGNSPVLIFSSVGYQAKEVPVGESNTLNVVLAGSGALEEVVITALGVEKENSKLGYSATTVKGAEIAQTNTVNPITALQGKVAGVNINVVGSSGVQSSPSIIIRGVTSLTSNSQPIFVIDGIVVENNRVNADDGADNGSQLKNLNPDNYESITILKGAAATSIYGSRGINGAVVITSKRGKISRGLGVEVNSTYQITEAYANSIPLQNVYGMGAPYIREGNFRPDGTTNLTSFSYGPKMDGRLYPALYDRTQLVPFSPHPDNWKTFYQNGNYINNSVALSSGSDKYTYRLSYGNTHNDGVLKNNSLKRNSFDFRATGQLNSVFSIDAGVNYANTKTTNPFGQNRYSWPGGTNVGFMTYYALPRNADLDTWRDNYRNPDGSVKNYGYGLWNDQVNSTFSRFDNRNEQRNENSLLANLQLTAQLTPWFDVSARGNINFYKIFTEITERGNGAGGIGGYYEVGGSYNSAYNSLVTAHATAKALNGDLGMDFRILNEIYGNSISERYRRNTRGGLIIPNEFILGNSALNTIDPSSVDYGFETPSNKVIGLAGIADFNYKEFLNLELTARNDWNSSLTYPQGIEGQNNFSVFYPSANLSYSFYDHLNTSMPRWLSSGRLRASLAYVGKGTDAYATSFGGFAPNVVFDENGNSISIAAQQNANVLPNPNLKPEIQRALEFGTNFGLFQDRLTFDFAYYKTNTFNQILTLPGVQETGYSSMRINAGNIQNQGLELLVNATPWRTRNWNLDVSFNFTRNRGKIVEFYPGITSYALLNNYNGASVYAYEGGTFGELSAENNWYQAYAELDAATNLPLLRISDRVVSTDPDTKHDIADYAYVYNNYSKDLPRIGLGRIEPNYLAGFNTTLRYKNFSFYGQIDSRVGGLLYSESYNYATGRGNTEISLPYRDQASGGVARTDSYTGQTVYDGVIPDAVFDAGQVSPLTGADISGLTFREAYDRGLVEPWKASAYYISNFGWGTNLNTNGSVSKNTWVMLRELSLGYQIPQPLLNKIKVRGAGLRFTARNIGYIYNGLNAKQNPESLQSNNPFNPVITGGVPFSRNYSLSLNLSF